MAERIADNADLAVDELKRRARRRLVGAVVLALAAAVILPLLLEKDPKPLGDDVSVQIPPVDEGRFINRLTGRDAKSAPKSDAKALPKNAAPKVDTPPPSPAPAAVAPSAPSAESVPAPIETAPASIEIAPPKKSIADAEQRVLSPATKAPAKADAKTEAKIAEPKASTETKGDSKTSNESPPTTSPPVVTAAAAPGVSAAPKAETFAVQIAAFTDDKGASALTGKLKRAGYASTYTEPVETSRGTLWRVRVGGFGSRPEAEAARAKLKTEGWNGLVVVGAAK